MNHIMPTLACVLALVGFAVGCEPNPKAALDGDRATELSATDLIALQEDFHAWKLLVPQSQQPLKRVELVLVRADGTRGLLFGTAQSEPAPGWTCILLGFRYEGGRFAGRLVGRGPKVGETYGFTFTNAWTEHPRSWSGAPLWNGAHAELATFWTSEEAARSGGNDYSTLAVELVK
jgi:hypothetical protein